MPKYNLRCKVCNVELIVHNKKAVNKFLVHHDVPGSVTIKVIKGKKSNAKKS